MNPNTFSMTSRYFGVEVAKYVTPDGLEIAYLRRRFIPLPDRYATIGVHVVTDHERPDLIAFQQLGDPEQFWRIADPNTVLRPEELTETVGRVLRITLAEGIPGPTNAQGIHLTLLIGPAVPIPAPQSVMDALTSVQVTSGKDRSAFQITFTVGKKSPLLTTMLPAGYFDPILTRVVIIATVGGFPNVLMDGLVTQQELSPSNDVGQSTLTITGEDLSLAMDIVDMIMPYPAMPKIAQIYTVLAKYAFLGIVPIAIPPIVPCVDIPTNKYETQTTTDRAYLQNMARLIGYVFYVEPGPAPMTSIAYFGPDIRLPIPQPALNVNMDAHTNVESLSFSLDGMAKKLTIITIFDPATNKIPIPIPIPNISIFHPPMGLRPTPPARIEFNTDFAKLKPDKAAEKVLGLLMNNSDAITASGTLDVLRYGRVLRSRMLVGVRGASLAYDGMYYVNTVTHNIKRGEYKQSFNLSRDGLISNTPKVIP